MDELAQRIGRNVRTLRERQGHSKTGFCLMSGVSRPYLNVIESGGSNPTVKELKRIADSLGIDIVDLFDGPDEEPGV